MPDFSPDLERAFALALAEAQRARSRVPGAPHLFIGLTNSRSRVPSVTAPGDVGLIVTAQMVAQVLAGWVNVPVEALE